MNTENIEKIKSIQESLTNHFPDLVKVQIITPEKLDHLDNIIVDIDNKIHHRYNVKAPATYIIRPDNYIAFSAKGLDLDSIEKFLKRYLTLKKKI